MSDAAASTFQLAVTIGLVFLLIVGWRWAKDWSRRRRERDHEPGRRIPLVGTFFLSLAIGVAIHFGLQSLGPPPPPLVHHGSVFLGTDLDEPTIQDLTRFLVTRAAAGDMREAARRLANERLDPGAIDQWLDIKIADLVPAPYEREGVALTVTVIVHGYAPESVRLESRRFSSAACLQLSWEAAMRLLATGPGGDRIPRGVMLAERCMTAVAQFAQRDRLDDFYDAARRDVSTRRDAAGDPDSRQAIEDLLRRIPRTR